MIRRLSLVLALLLLASSFAAANDSAPTPIYSIRVQGAADPSSLTVQVKGRDWILSADADGNLRSVMDDARTFALSNGVWEFEILSAKGKTHRSVVLSNGSPARIVLRLEGGERTAEKTRHLDVMQAEETVKMQDRSRQVMTSAQARMLPGSGGDSVRAVESLPGVQAPGGFYGFYVRGSDRFDNAYRLNHMPIRDPYHGLLGGLASVFPSDAIEDVSLSAAGFPASIGGAQGGAMILRTRKERPDKDFHLDLTLNTGYAGVSTTFAIGDALRVTAGGRVTFLEPIFTAMSRMGLLPDWYKDVKSFGFYDYFSEIALKLSSSQSLRLLAVGSSEVQKIETSRLEVIEIDGFTNRLGHRQDENNGWYAQSLEWRAEGDRVANSLTVSRLKSAHDELTFSSPVLRATRESWRITEDFDAKLAPWWKLNLGAEGGLDRETGTMATVKVTDLPTLEPNAYRTVKAYYEGLSNAFARADQVGILFERQTIAAWLHNEWILGPAVLHGGARFTWDFAARNLEVEPRFDATWALGKAASLMVAAGRYVQFPDYFNYIPQQVAYQQPASPDHPVTWNFAAGGEVKAGLFDIRVDGFYKDFRNQTLRNPTYDVAFSNFESADPRSVYTGTGRAYGVELGVKRNLGKGFFGWLTYSLGRSERSAYVETNVTYVFTDTNNNGMDFKNIPQETLPFYQDVTHMAKLLLSWQPSDHFRLGGRATLKSGTPYTKQRIQFTDGGAASTVAAPNGAVDLGELRFVNAAERMGERTPAVFNLDLRVDWMFKVGKKADMTIFLDLWNVQALFYANVTGITYDSAILRSVGASEFRTLRTGDVIDVPSRAITNSVWGLPFIPGVGVELHF